MAANHLSDHVRNTHLLGTKLRALLQRRKNRDLFDLHTDSRSSDWTATRS